MSLTGTADGTRLRPRNGRGIGEAREATTSARASVTETAGNGLTSGLTMPSEQVTRSLQTVREAMDRKGFEGLYVTHYDDTPSGHVVLHDDHGRLARGDGAQLERAIDAAGDLEGLWSDLDRAGMGRRAS
jgi:hypothetical protein